MPRWFSVVLLVSLAACRSGMSAVPETLGAPAPALTLEPGDVVDVVIWREKDLSGEFMIDETGRLTLPLLGVTRAVGRSWTDLRDSLQTEYRRQLRNPSVTLTPLRRVLVLGEVAKPGPYLTDPTLSLAGIVAQAGGATPNGDLRRVRVMREGKTVVKSTSVEHLLLTGGIRSNDQVFVDRRPWIERNGALLASALISTAGIAVALIR